MGERPTPLPSLVWQQIRYQNALFWRSPVSAVFTLVLPLLFLFLFALLLSGTTPTRWGPVGVAQFYAPSLAVFAAASATYTNLAVTTAVARDEGILKRIRGTPLPPWVYLAGRIGSAAWIALIGVVVMMGVGSLAYGIRLEPDALPAAGIAFGLGVAAFAVLGLMVAGLTPSGDAAPAVANATLLPLAFVSDVFVNVQTAPAWVRLVGDVFPLRHFVHAFQAPFLSGRFELDPVNVAVMVLWTLGGAAVALRSFRWEPAHERVGGERRGGRSYPRSRWRLR